VCSFCEFNSLRKNQLLAFYEQIKPLISGCGAAATSNKYRDYYFMPQFEVGQQELIDVHHYSYMIDLMSMICVDRNAQGDHSSMAARVRAVNQQLVEHIHFSTQRQANYDKMMKLKDFVGNKKYYDFFLSCFLSIRFFDSFCGLGKLLVLILLISAHFCSFLLISAHFCSFLLISAHFCSFLLACC
jgi:hypothetical protein